MRKWLTGAEDLGGAVVAWLPVHIGKHLQEVIPPGFAGSWIGVQTREGTGRALGYVVSLCIPKCPCRFLSVCSKGLATGRGYDQSVSSLAWGYTLRPAWLVVSVPPRLAKPWPRY